MEWNGPLGASSDLPQSVLHGCRVFSLRWTNMSPEVRNVVVQWTIGVFNITYFSWRHPCLKLVTTNVRYYVLQKHSKNLFFKLNFDGFLDFEGSQEVWPWVWRRPWPSANQIVRECTRGSYDSRNQLHAQQEGQLLAFTTINCIQILCKTSS